MILSTQPTPYSEVNTLLLTLFAKVQNILLEKLVGFYLYGSLSLGDFDPRTSDVDFLVVTTEEITAGPLFDELHTMHTELHASNLPYARRLEGSYISRTALRRHDPDNCQHPGLNIQSGFQIAKHEDNWIIERYIVREYGIVICGPSPTTLIDPISSRELKLAVCRILQGWWQQQSINPGEWLYTRGLQAFAILTMCRALYSLHHQGMPVSKPVAAAWALQTLEAGWHPLIERALTWHHQYVTDDVEDLDALAEMLEFLRFTITASTELCP